MRNSILRVTSVIILPLFLCLPGTVSSQETGPAAAGHTLDISYGMSTLTIQEGPVQAFKLANTAPSTGKLFSFFKTAEASMPNGFAPAVYEKICTTIRDAGGLADLKPVLSERYFQTLSARVTPQSSQYTVLTTVQGMRPKSMHILEANVQGNTAEIAVTGVSYLGPMQGKADLVLVDGMWKVDRETWMVGGRERRDPLDLVLKAAPDRERTYLAPSTGILSGISPDYAVNRNFLELTPVPNDRRKRTVMFVFMMNGEKNQAESDPTDKLNPRIKAPRARMHILVPGAKRLLQEQKLIENEYPVDVSMAKYEDGYAAKEWNMVLPGKKPREVRVSFMWSF